MRERLDGLQDMWYNVSMMKYDEMLRVRVSTELKEELQRRAQLLQVPVSTLARWGLRFAATTHDVAGLLDPTLPIVYAQASLPANHIEGEKAEETDVEVDE